MGIEHPVDEGADPGAQSGGPLQVGSLPAGHLFQQEEEFVIGVKDRYFEDHFVQFEGVFRLIELGIGLLLFVGLLEYTAFRQLHNRRLVGTIIVLDAAWVIGSVLLIVFQGFGLSVAGYGVVAVVALVVGILGWQQYRHLMWSPNY